MPDERWQKVQSVFTDALYQPSGERVAFLDRACGQDVELRQEVASLLEHDTIAAGGFLEPPKTTLPFPIIEPDSFVGTQIGQYGIKRVIGSGGMGTVYEAEQQRPKRLVALKVVKADHPKRSHLRRLEYESEVLAHLQHPHIAQIFEAGTHRHASGRMLPYFVMEYVQGAKSITKYAAENKLGTRDRLSLFSQACEAVHHGHQKGVIHRDLKPANILVCSRGQVKVIDFGVARATDSDVAVTTLRTDVGSLIGTLQYMSPEQCEADPLGLDIRSDVYSLGVILYELLTGQLPYNVAGRPIPSATRTICESEPTRPSTIDRKLRGDLEIIVLTAMEKDRSKRYQSAGALTADIRRYLQHEPISARPRSRWIKVVDWAGRHPRLATTLVCVLIAVGIVGGTASTVSIMHHPSRLMRNADGSAVYLHSVTGRILHEWPSQPTGITVAQLVQRPMELGGGQLAAIGYSGAELGQFGGQLGLFSLSGERNVPLWNAEVLDSDIPPNLKKRAFVGRDFHPQAVLQADVFPNVVGAELIVAYQHNAYTHTTLRVYNPFVNRESEQLLYSVWVDAEIRSMYWMADAGLLIFAGTNGEAFWPDRGYEQIKTRHPKVVFALRPELGFRTLEYVGEAPGTTNPFPVWYQLIGPPDATDLGLQTELRPPHGASMPGRSVALNIAVGADGRLEFVVDEFGREIPGTRRTADGYKLDPNLPREDYVQLQDLPPIQVVKPGGRDE